MKKKFFGMMTVFVAVMLVFCLAGCGGDDDTSDGGDGFIITGYPGPAYQQLYASTDGNITDGSTLVLNNSGIGNINADGTISWISGINGPSGTFWLYIFMADSSLMKSNTQIEMSSGSVAYSEFTPI